MLELALAAAILAALLWLAHCREQEAERRGYVAGDYAASQRAAERAQRYQEGTDDGYDG